MQKEISQNRFDDETADYKSCSTTNSQKKLEGKYLNPEPTEPNFSVHRYTASSHSSISTRSLSERSLDVVQKDERTYLFEVIPDCSDFKLKEMFKSVSGRIGFSVRMDHMRKLLAEKYVRPSYFKELLCCCSDANSSTIVALQITTETLKQKKFLTIRLLQGLRDDFDLLISDLKLEVKALVKDQKIVTYNTMRKRNKNCPVTMEIQAYELVSNLMKARFSLKASEVKTQISNLCNTMEASLPINKRPEQLIELLVKSSRDIKFEMEQSSQSYNQEFVLFGIERYLMLMVHDNIMRIYSAKYSTTNQLYETRRIKILEKWDTPKCMQYLDIKKKYQLVEGSKQPYQRAIRTLENLSLQLSPRDKLKCIQEYYSDIKICCYEYHKGREEISAMDDILPVMIYTVLQASVPQFNAHLKIVDDYIRIVGRFEADQRVLTNLFVGLQYIAKEWVIE